MQSVIALHQDQDVRVMEALAEETQDEILLVVHPEVLMDITTAALHIVFREHLVAVVVAVPGGNGRPRQLRRTQSLGLLHSRLQDQQGKVETAETDDIGAVHPCLPSNNATDLLNWFRDMAKRIGTWHQDAGDWFDATVRKAKAQHREYVSSTPTQQMMLETRYVLGRMSPIRWKVWLGVHTTKDIMWFTLKVLQPSPDFLRIGISRNLMIRTSSITNYDSGQAVNEHIVCLWAPGVHAILHTCNPSSKWHVLQGLDRAMWSGVYKLECSNAYLMVCAVGTAYTTARASAAVNRRVVVIDAYTARDGGASQHDHAQDCGWAACALSDWPEMNLMVDVHVNAPRGWTET
eukprot:992087-Amphidinium_carterae.1